MKLFCTGPDFPLFNLDHQEVHGENFEICLSDPAQISRWRALSSQTRRSLFVIREARQLEDLLHATTATEREQVQWVFPYDGALLPSQIAALQVDFPSLLDRELHDPRIAIDLFPRAEVLQQARSATRPAVSIILPCLDKPQALTTALSFWQKQIGPSFELIVVDDGSAQPWILSLCGQFPEQLTLLRLSERNPTHEQDDHRFRAGLARNAGIAAAQGEILLFSDCDILVPVDFLERVVAALQSSDLVMPLRWQLHPRMVDVTPETPLRVAHHAILTPGAHWEDFQVSTQDWMQTPQAWKWVSSFCLAVRRALVDSIGPFRRSFVTYGFEDSEFGYRALRAGAKFQLLNVNTFHLPQSDQESQFANNLERRHRLFCVSAERFFRHHPQPAVFAALKPWLS
jgi:hypothetical protein